MSTAELENWLSRIKDFSVNELLALQEEVRKELRLKTLAAQNAPTDVKSENQVDGITSASKE